MEQCSEECTFLSNVGSSQENGWVVHIKLRLAHQPDHEIS